MILTAGWRCPLAATCRIDGDPARGGGRGSRASGRQRPRNEDSRGRRPGPAWDRRGRSARVPPRSLPIESVVVRPSTPFPRRDGRRGVSDEARLPVEPRISTETRNPQGPMAPPVKLVVPVPNSITGDFRNGTVIHIPGHLTDRWRPGECRPELRRCSRKSRSHDQRQPERARQSHAFDPLSGGSNMFSLRKQDSGSTRTGRGGRSSSQSR